MTPDQHARLQEIMDDALDLAPGEQTAFLERACGQDPEMLTEARSLLAYDAKDTGRFLETPAYALSKDGPFVARSGGELQPGDRLGDCRLLELLGEGGMGEVYLAEDTRLGRKVAVKLLKRHPGDETLPRRFEHERRVLAALNHPNIARLYDATTTPEGRSYLVMEHVEGERLDEFCHARGLGMKERLALFRKVCAAVAYAHQNLVVHRDLKPANIRVTPEGEPKLLDFGIAKLLDPEDAPGADLTVTLFAVMTPEYASPEQVRGEPITTASDVYSLGVILYELLTGQRPYRLKSRRPDELARAICEEPAPRPSTVAATAATQGDGSTAVGETPARLHRLLRGDLDNIIGKALAKEPARRYPSVVQLSDDLRRHGEGLPISARRDTLAYRAGKFTRRNKTLVAAVVLVTLALLAGLVAATWQARVARQERDRARLAQTKAETALKQAKRINDFLQNLFASPDTAKLGKDVKVLQVLDAVSKNLERDLGNEPEVLAQVHLTIAQTYDSLLVINPALEHAQAAYDLFHRLRGDGDPNAILALEILAVNFTQRRLYDQAESASRRALASLERQPAPDPGVKSNLLRNLVVVYAETGRIHEAEAGLAEMKSFVLRTMGENSREYAEVFFLLGTQKRAAGDYAAAAAADRQALVLYDRNEPNSLHGVGAQGNLCLDLFALGQFDEFGEAVRRFAQDAKQIAGDDSYYNVMSWGLSSLYDFSQGNFVASINNARRSLDKFKAVYSPDFFAVIQMQGVLGLSLTRTGQAQEGEPFLRQAVENGQKADKVEFVYTFGNAESALGECLLAQGRHAEAELLLLAGHDDLKARLGENHLQSVRVRRLLRDLYTTWNKPEQAARFVVE